MDKALFQAKHPTLSLQTEQDVIAISTCQKLNLEDVEHFVTLLTQHIYASLATSLVGSVVGTGTFQ